jgi:hypothetical protein
MVEIFTGQEKPRLVGENLPYKRTWFMSLLLLLKVLNKKFNGQMRIGDGSWRIFFQEFLGAA